MGMVVFTKTPFKPRHFAATILVLAGHFCWFLLGGVVTGAWSAALIDLSLMGAALLWLWFRPSWGVALVLGGFTLLAVLMNGVQMAIGTVGSPEHRALVVHLALRVLTLVALWFEYVRFRTAGGAASEAPLRSEIP
jgi:hypothetical protein